MFSKERRGAYFCPTYIEGGVLSSIYGLDSICRFYYICRQFVLHLSALLHLWSIITFVASTLVTRENELLFPIKHDQRFGVYLSVRTRELFLCFAPFVFLGSIVLNFLFPLFYVTREFYRLLQDEPRFVE